jgi:hypothetical protein
LGLAGKETMGKDTGRPPIGEAYDTGDEIVICGTPPEFSDSVPEDDPRRHNCDAMGCGCAHVLYRFRKPNAGREARTARAGGDA